jgi:hypothetical protein
MHCNGVILMVKLHAYVRKATVNIANQCILPHNDMVSAGLHLHAVAVHQLTLQLHSQDRRATDVLLLLVLLGFAQACDMTLVPAWSWGFLAVC